MTQLTDYDKWKLDSPDEEPEDEVDDGHLADLAWERSYSGELPPADFPADTPRKGGE